MAAVDDACAADLEAAAFALGMDVLVEVHDEEELDASAAPEIAAHRHQQPQSENLRDDARDQRRGWRRLVPAGRIVVGESGIFAPADLARLAKAGISTFLVGESLMRQNDVAAATRALLARSSALAPAR